jgi:hypothetical protein
MKTLQQYKNEFIREIKKQHQRYEDDFHNEIRPDEYSDRDAAENIWGSGVLDLLDFYPGEDGEEQCPIYHISKDLVWAEEQLEEWRQIADSEAREEAIAERWG